MFKLLKLMLLAICAAFVLPPPVDAQSTSRRIEPLNLTVKKSLVVAKNTSAVANQYVAIEIGDTMFNKYSLLMHPTDTSVVPIAFREFGMQLLNKSDTTYYTWVGNAWRKTKPN